MAFPDTATWRIKYRVRLKRAQLFRSSGNHDFHVLFQKQRPLRVPIVFVQWQNALLELQKIES
jgi:hypothetical protein